MFSYDFSDRHAVVTGAGGGMGEALAKRLLEAGARVTAFDLKPVPDSIAGSDGLVFYQGDISDLKFVSDAINIEAERNGGVDYLANVAGVLWFGKDMSVLEMELTVWDRVFEINLKSIAHTSRAVVPHMKPHKGASMVHFSTIQWYRGDPAPQDAYQASKAAVCALSKSLAMQLAKSGIRSNAICPGVTMTPLQARWEGQEDIIKTVEAHIPLGRMAAAEDMASAALFLLSDAASYITGIELAVDGGLLMRM